MSESLGLMLLREGVVTPAELVEALKARGRHSSRDERVPVVGALVAAIDRFRQADRDDVVRHLRERDVLGTPRPGRTYRSGGRPGYDG
jgi:hypothetical protein